MEKKAIKLLTVNLIPGCDRIPTCLISNLANIEDNRVGANNTKMLMSSFG